MNIQAYIDRSNEGLDEDEGDDLMWVQGGVSKKSIKTVEKKIGFVFPESYRSFLSDFGSIAAGDSTVSGIDNADPLALKGGTIYGDTLFMRDDFKDQYAVPEHLWVLVKHEDGAYCFNFNVKTDEDEYAIVNYEPHLPLKTFEEPVARTFHEFLVKRFF